MKESFKEKQKWRLPYIWELFILPNKSAGRQETKDISSIMTVISFKEKTFLIPGKVGKKNSALFLSLLL